MKNSSEFAKEVHEIKLDPDEELRSYNVSTLFMSVPIDKVLEVIRLKLEEYNTLSERTPLEHVISSNYCGCACLNCTYLLFHGEYYLQIHGVAMGSPVSQIMCNLYMESLEQKALATTPKRPRWWCRYLDDTLRVLKKIYS